MAKLSIQIQGLDKLTRKLIKNQALTEAKEVVKKNTAQMHEKTISNMISTYTKGYRTGNTENNTAFEIEDGGLSGVQTTTTDYIQYLEQGTRYMAAEPAIKPAFDAQKVEFKKQMEDLAK